MLLTVLIDDETAGEVMQDDWLESMAQETLCCMCARKPGTSDETARKLRRSIVNGRLETGKPVLLLDWDGDVRLSEQPYFGVYDLRQRPGRRAAPSLCSWADFSAPLCEGAPAAAGGGRRTLRQLERLRVMAKNRSLRPFGHASLAGGQVLPHKMTKTDPVPML